MQFRKVKQVIQRSQASHDTYMVCQNDFGGVKIISSISTITTQILAKYSCFIYCTKKKERRLSTNSNTKVRSPQVAVVHSLCFVCSPYPHSTQNAQQTATAMESNHQVPLSHCTPFPTPFAFCQLSQMHCDGDGRRSSRCLFRP